MRVLCKSFLDHDLVLKEAWADFLLKILLRNFGETGSCLHVHFTIILTTVKISTIFYGESTYTFRWLSCLLRLLLACTVSTENPVQQDSSGALIYTWGTQNYGGGARLADPACRVLAWALVWHNRARQPGTWPTHRDLSHAGRSKQTVL